MVILCGLQGRERRGLPGFEDLEKNQIGAKMVLARGHKVTSPAEDSKVWSQELGMSANARFVLVGRKLELVSYRHGGISGEMWGACNP